MRERNKPGTWHHRTTTELRVRLIRAHTRDALFTALRNGDADIGVAALPAPADLSARQFAVREVVLVSPDRVALPDAVTTADLHGLPLVLPPPGCGRRDDLYRDLVEHLDYQGTVVRGFDPPVRGAAALLRLPFAGAPAEGAEAFVRHAEAEGLRPAVA